MHMKESGFETESTQVGASRAGIVNRIWEEFEWLLRVAYSSSSRFYWDNGFSKAASLAYTTLFSLVPVTVFGFGILASVVLANDNLLESVRAFIIKQFVPDAAGADLILEYLKAFSEQMMMLLRFEDATFRVSVFALVFLVLSCLVLINSIEYTLNQVWQVFEPRGIARKLSVFCTIIVVGPVLAVSAFYTNIFIGRQVSEFVLLDHIYSRLVPFVIDCLVFTVLYFLVPKAPVRLSSSFFGACVAAVLFDLGKYGFSLYITSFSSYQQIYGTISTIVIFLFWLYLCWTVILIGAEFSYQVQYLPRRGHLVTRDFMSVGDGRLTLALQALLIIARNFLEGGRLPSDLDLAEALGCSSIALRPVLAELKSAGIITQSDSREGSIALAKSPEKISVHEIRDVLFRNAAPVHFAQQLSAAYAAMSPGKISGSCSLADLISTGNPDV